MLLTDTKIQSAKLLKTKEMFLSSNSKLDIPKVQLVLTNSEQSEQEDESRTLARSLLATLKTRLSSSLRSLLGVTSRP